MTRENLDWSRILLSIAQKLSNNQTLGAADGTDNNKNGKSSNSDSSITVNSAPNTHNHGKLLKSE